MKRLLLLLFLCIVFSCKNNTEDAKKLTNDDMNKIHDFVKKLDTVFQNYDYEFFSEAWSHDHFRNGVSGLNDTEKGLFDHIYKTQTSQDISFTNNELINQIRHENGDIDHLKTDIVNNDHAEVTYIMVLNERFYFFKYKIEMANGQPKLSDIFFFREDQWMSEKMKEIIRLNVDYQAASTNRHEANRSLDNYHKALAQGDALNALIALNNIPKSHQIISELRMSRIQLASQLNDSIFNVVMAEEMEKENNLYMDYYISQYLNDSIQTNELTQRIVKETGVSKALLDWLIAQGLHWN